MFLFFNKIKKSVLMLFIINDYKLLRFWKKICYMNFQITICFSKINRETIMSVMSQPMLTTVWNGAATGRRNVVGRQRKIGIIRTRLYNWHVKIAITPTKNVQFCSFFYSADTDIFAYILIRKELGGLVRPM